MTTLYHTIKRLANEVPETRSVLVPLLRTLSAGCEKLPEGGMRDNCEKKQKGKGEDKKEARFISEVEEMISKFAAAPSYKDYVEKKRKQNKKPLSKDEWERKVLKTGPANQPKKDEGGKKKDEGKSEKLKVPDTKAVGEILSQWGGGGAHGSIFQEVGSHLFGGHPMPRAKLQEALEAVSARTTHPDEWKLSKEDLKDFKKVEKALTKALGKKSEPGAKAKSYKKSYPKPATSIMDKHSLTDDDADQVKNFKKGKPKAGVELTPAQLMQKFLAKAKPETKERMKDMSPADFVKLLGVLTDDEGAEG